MKIYTVLQAAKLLHMSERTVYELIYQKKLQAVKLGGKWLIKEEWIEELIMATAEKAG